VDKSPDAFRTISEVAEELSLPQHVLRFWETRFSQIKPMKRAGGRRYYRPDDFVLLQGIRHLLYDQGYTIKGVQKLLKQNGNRYVIAIGAGDTAAAEAILAAKEAEEDEAMVMQGARVASPAPQVEAPEANHILGKAKAPSSLRFIQRKKDDDVATDPAVSAGSNKALAEEDRALLQEALYDLLECKRLLDQTR
jgi:DNA-binding transcriptional MerR regulator